MKRLNFSPERGRAWLFALGTLVVAGGLALRWYHLPLPGNQMRPAAPLATLPPGLDSDEAFHDLAALRLIQSGQLVPFFKIDQGIPAAMICLIALVFKLIGPTAEGGRLVSAVLGSGLLLGLPWLAASLYPRQPAAVVFTAAQAAFIFWFVDFSRIGLEQMTAAVLITLGMAALWIWRQRGGYRWAASAGAALALALYAYPAAYFLPVAAATIGVYWASLAQPRWRPRWREALMVCGVGALVAAPLLLFAIHNPEWILRRPTQTGGPQAWAQLPEHLLRTLGALVWRGDSITRHNIDYRPLLDPVQIMLAGLGLIYALRHWRQAPYGLTLLWFAVMLFPATLSDSPEHFGRLVGSVLAVALLGGLGGAALWQWLMRRRAAWPWLGAGLVTLGVIFSAVKVTRDYFVVWPQLPGYQHTFDVPERLQAEVILQHPEAASYLSPSDAGRSMFAFFWRDQALAKSFDGRACTVAPILASRPTQWVINTAPHEDPLSGSRLARLYPNIKTEVLYAETGTPTVTRFSVPAGARPQYSNQALGGFGDFVQLSGLRLGAALTQGATLPVELTWQVIASPRDDWTVGLYLLNAAGAVVTQDDGRPCRQTFLTTVWQPGDLIVEQRTLGVPAHLPAGDYALALAFYRLSDGVRAPAFAGDGRPSGTLLTLQKLAAR